MHQYAPGHTRGPHFHVCEHDIIQHRDFAVITTSPRSRNALRHQITSRFCGKYDAKCSQPDSWASNCASLRKLNALRHHATSRLCSTRFVRACAVETHFDIIQHHDVAVNTTQNARGQAGHRDLAPGLYSYRKNPTLDTLFGEKI